LASKKLLLVCELVKIKVTHNDAEKTKNKAEKRKLKEQARMIISKTGAMPNK
jgi:hypothetical protein